MGVLTPNAAHWAVGEVRVELGIAGSGQAGRADARGTAGKDWKVQSGSFFFFLWVSWQARLAQAARNSCRRTAFWRQSAS